MICTAFRNSNRFYKYIFEVKTMLKMGNWMLPPTKNNQHKFISTSWVHDICKWFARWHIEECLDVHVNEKEVTREHESMLYLATLFTNKGEQHKIDLSLKTIAAILKLNIGKIAEPRWPMLKLTSGHSGQESKTCLHHMNERTLTH